MSQDDLFQEFLSLLDVGESPVRPGLTPCWYWAGRVGAGGYGYVNPRRWGDQYAHRWSYKHYNGEIPEGHEIRHLCDERSCVNPEHLHTGTHAENMRDVLERNESAFRRCVNNATARKIRAQRAAGASYKSLMNEYKISLRTVGRIIRGESKYIALLG